MAPMGTVFLRALQRFKSLAYAPSPPRTPRAGPLWALFSLGPCSDSNRWHFRKQRLRSLGHAKVTAIRIAGVQEAIAGAQEATGIQIAGVHHACMSCDFDDPSMQAILLKASDSFRQG